MKIDEIYYNCELEDVLTELQNQLIINGYPYLKKGFKRSGNSLQVQCPYHGGGQEKHPSYGIRRSDGIGHCFACGEIHTLPEFISACFDKDDITGRFGRRWLNKNFNAIEVEERDDIELDLNRGNKKVKEHPNYVDEKELDSYRYYHPYWTERGIVEEDIIELFDLGYDKKTDSITFPVRDIDGNCLFVARRSVKIKFFNYPEGVEKPLYGLYELKQATQHQSYHMNITEKGHMPGLYNIFEVIVCESMIDCILLWQAGYYAVALNGLGNQLQMKQLQSLPSRELILATDNDEAGYKARRTIRKNIKNKLISEIVFPNNIKDIGDCTIKQIENILKWKQF